MAKRKKIEVDVLFGECDDAGKGKGRAYYDDPYVGCQLFLTEEEIEEIKKIINIK